MNHSYRHRLEEATNCTVYTIGSDRWPVYQLVGSYGDVIAEFDEFEDLQAYTIETVERVEASRGIA